MHNSVTIEPTSVAIPDGVRSADIVYDVPAQCVKLANVQMAPTAAQLRKRYAAYFCSGAAAALLVFSIVTMQVFGYLF